MSSAKAGVTRNILRRCAGPTSQAFAINASGQTVGAAQISANGPFHAFRTTAAGVITPAGDLGTLGGVNSFATGISDAGRVVGYSRNTNNVGVHAFRTAPNAAINPATDDLGTLGGTNSQAYAINSLGQVVGWAQATPPDEQAFFADAAGKMQDLNGLIDPDSGWLLHYAQGINDAGQITGYGVAPNGENHAFLLIPVPEPGGAAIALLAVASAAARARRHRDASGSQSPRSFV